VLGGGEGGGRSRNFAFLHCLKYEVLSTV